MNININVKDKIATLTNDIEVVCGNSDYVVNFTFDSEWGSHNTKTMRVQHGSQYTDVVFTGSSANLPVIQNVLGIKIGVFAGNLHTTTPAYIDTVKSILCEGGTPVAPTPSVYAQILEQLNDLEEEVEDKIDDAPSNNKKYARKNGAWVEVSGGGTGTDDYEDLNNKPKINNVELIGNKSLNDLGIVIKTKTSELQNDSGFIDNTYHDSTKANKSNVDTIESKIPDQATSENKLADKNFVNSSIATNTAYYISNNGEPFTSVAQLEAYSGTVTNNDYAFVTGTDESGNAYYDRYKATVSGSTVTWAKEFRLNNSSFTAAQWAAITSGMTSLLVTKLNGIEAGAQVNPINVSAFTNDSGYLTLATLPIYNGGVE